MKSAYNMSILFCVLWMRNAQLVNGIPDERVDQIEVIKCPQDHRSYRAVKLSNNLKVLLIHDPTATTAAVSLTVGAGTVNNIGELSNVADFLGSQSGISATSPPPKITEITQTYSFEIQQSGMFFYVALDEFANHFIDPQLSSDDTIRTPSVSEVIGSLSLVETSLGEKQSRFIQSDIEKSTWFSANIMTLVVLTQDSLDAIENEVSNLFGRIKDKEVTRIPYTVEDSIWGTNLLGHKVCIVPEKEEHFLRLHFIHPDIHDQYKKAPVRYASYLIEHQGPNTLASVLQKKKLCLNIRTDYNFAVGVGNFNILCDLTKEGLKDVDQIIRLIFQYINWLTTDGVTQQIFKELQEIDDLAFTYKDNDESALSYVESLSVALQHYPFEDVLSYNFKHNEWEESLIKKFFGFLKPTNMNIFIISKSFQEVVDPTNTWFGMSYKIDDIPTEQLREWSEAEPLAEFKLPPQNNFIPKSRELYKVKEKESTKPYPLQESYISQIWFKQTPEFKTPKLHVYLHFWSPMSRMDPSYRCLLEIFLKIMNSTLRERLHLARVAGIDWSVTTSTYGGVIVDVHGYEDKLFPVLEEIIVTFTQYETKLELTEELFLEVKQEFQEDLSLRGTKTRPPGEHGWDYLKFLLSEAGWTDEDLLIVLEPVNFEDLKDFLPDLMLHIYIQGLIHGNCPKTKAMNIVNMLEKPFESIYGLLPQQLLPGRIVKLTDRSHYVYMTTNKNPRGYAYYSYHQLICKTMKDHVTAHLLVQVIDVWCRDLLGKPKLHQQSGCGSFTMSGVQGIFIMTISDEIDTLSMDTRVDELIKEIPEILKQMSDEQFKNVKEDLTTKKTRQPLVLRKLSEQLFFEIENRTYYFDRHSDEAKELEKLQKSDVLTLHKQNLEFSAATRNKLAVHIIPETTPPLPMKIPSGATKIDNITMFKSSLRLLPLPRPQISINAPGNKSKLREMSGDL